MSLYWKRCPHCGRIIDSGHGRPFKRFGNPVRKCLMCQNTYIDKDVIDWPNASVLKKVSYYLANGRLLICILMQIFSGAVICRVFDIENPFLAGLPAFLVSLALCIIYVQIQVKLEYGHKRPNRHRNSKEVSLDEQYKKYQNGLFYNHNRKEQ